MDKWKIFQKILKQGAFNRENVEFWKEKFAFSSCKHLSSLSIYFFEKEKSSDSKDKAAHKQRYKFFTIYIWID